jgi:hypothetical protein
MTKSLDQIWQEMQTQRKLNQEAIMLQEKALLEQREAQRQSYLKQQRDMYASSGRIYNNTVNGYVDTDYVEDYIV